MNSLELIASLRKQAESIHIPDEVRPAAGISPIECEPGTSEYASDCMRRYNYEAYLEITNPETTVAVANIDDDAIMEFELILGAYMDAYAPNRTNLKNYVKLVSLYLAFVAKRPLHPPSIMAPDSEMGSSLRSRYYCFVRKTMPDERFPICRYCVAYSSI